MTREQLAQSKPDDAANVNFDRLFALSEAAPEAGGPAADGGRFQAAAPPRTDETRLFGGLLLGQAIVAASRHGRRCHSLHAYFLSQGIVDRPLDLRVESIRKGRSFDMFRVDIAQDGGDVLSAMTSHHDGDAGPRHGVAMPDLPFPDDGDDPRWHADSSWGARSGKRFLTMLLLEIRRLDLPSERTAGVAGRGAFWCRARAPIGGGPAIHQAAIAFASDMGLVAAGLQPNREGGGPRIQSASLDHAIWFHDEAPADDWLLHVQTAPAMKDGRGFASAAVFDRSGRLVASVAQEFLSRERRESSADGD